MITTGIQFDALESSSLDSVRQLGKLPDNLLYLGYAQFPRDRGSTETRGILRQRALDERLCINLSALFKGPVVRQMLFNQGSFPLDVYTR